MWLEIMIDVSRNNSKQVLREGLPPWGTGNWIEEYFSKVQGYLTS